MYVVAQLEYIRIRHYIVQNMGPGIAKSFTHYMVRDSSYLAPASSTSEFMRNLFIFA